MLYQVTHNDEPVHGYVFCNEFEAWDALWLLAMQERAKDPTRYEWMDIYTIDFDVQEIEEPIDILINWGVPEDAARYFLKYEAPEDFDVRDFDPCCMFGDRLVLFTEEEFDEEMHFFDCSAEDQFIERDFAAGIWRDASFEGVLVWLIG